MPLFFIHAAVVVIPMFVAAAFTTNATTAEIITFVACGAIGGGAFTFGIYEGVTLYQESKHRESLLRQRAILEQRGQDFRESAISLVNRTNNLTIELETMNGSANTAQENYNRLENIINELNAEVGPRIIEIKQLNDESRAYHVVITDMLQEDELHIKALIEKNTVLVRQLTELVTRVDEISGIINRLKNELAAAESRIVALEQSNNNLISVVTEQNEVIDTQNEVIEFQTEDIDFLRASTSALIKQGGFFRELSGHSLSQESSTENTPKL